MNKKLLIISYYANMPGACQAEWLDDKIDSIKKASYDVDVVSSNCAAEYDKKLVNHWRIPSVSLSDFLDEKKRVLEAGRKLRVGDWFMTPLVFTIGVVLDLMQYLLTKGVGEGRWSWALPAWLTTNIICILNRPSIILSTGGPASAHLAAIMTGKLFRLPVIVELQDPLSGDGIGRNSQARGWLYKVEKLIIRYATKVVYVTEAAAKFARQQFKSNNIVAVYPGAKKFDIKRKNQQDKANKFRLVHLGSLYATRNFTSIIAAVDKLINENSLLMEDVELINLGHVADHIRQEIIKKPYVKIFPPVSRSEALQFASDCDVVLLIQNSDDRSQVTIPYKTYDYLNLSTPLIGLLNSDELTILIRNTGHSALQLNDVDKISATVLEIFNNRNCLINSSAVIEPVVQAQQLLELSG